MEYLSRTKALLVLILSVLLLFTLVGCGGGNEDLPVDEPVDEPPTEAVTNEPNWDAFNAGATEFVELMNAGDFDTATTMFNEELAAVVDADTLEEVWDGFILAQAGAFTAVYEIENIETQGFYVVLITLEHENMGVLLNFTFSEDGLLAGFTVDGFPTLGEVEPIEFAGFTDYPIIIGEGTDWPLAGMLSMPDDTSVPVPAVVIVAGSGAHDMDPTTLPTPIYREIAHFLAENGIAVIRHDKRTYTHGVGLFAEMGNSMTVWEEAIEDAVLAAELLRADPRIDPDRVYIIGHSLGAILAPRIHENGGDFAGLIMMAGSPRCLLQIAAEQNAANIADQVELGLIEAAIEAGQIEESEVEAHKATVQALQELAATLLDFSAEEAKDIIVPLFNNSLYYWRDLNVNSFAHYVQNITVPMLVMQPERDFQITADVDFVALQELLAEHDNVIFRLYEDLDHVFTSSRATNFIEHAASVMAGGHVDRSVLQDIVDWILS